MDKELLNAISLIMDEKLKPMQQEIAEIKQEVVKTNIEIENEIAKRLDALMDGYILNHEETTDLKKRVEAIETKVS